MTTPLILAMDTALGPASIALLQGDAVLAQHHEADGRQQSARLVQDMDALLKQAGVAYNQLSAVAACTGPGGFTGIRIALAAARGVGFACKIPVLGFSSLAIAAMQHGKAGQKILVALNAYREQAYTQCFKHHGHTVEPLDEATATPLEDVPALVEALSPDLLATNLADMAADVPRVAIEGLDTVALARLAQAHLADAASHPAEATYIRPPDAKPQAALF